MKGTQQWDLIITHQKGWLDLQLRDLWRYRDLILLFIKRDFVALYKQTILGPLWYLIQPVISTVIFTIIFGRIARIPTDGAPEALFYLSGILCWGYFAECVTTTSNTFLSNASIFGKVYFPRLAVPISVVLSNLIKLGIHIALFVLIYMYFALEGSALRPSLWALCIPLLILQMALLGLGFGILVSSLTTKYRDLTLLVSFGMQLWMYATPVAYPISQVPDRLRLIYSLNPMAAVINNFRAVTLGIGTPNVFETALSSGITLLVLTAGVIMFTRIEKSFMDTV